jgi:NAD(P)-dependent dehydrogenase (short-subunit alcohol dehydrogenase family)
LQGKVSAQVCTMSGKFVVITGVSKGCGWALAEWMVANGHTVAGCGRDAAALERLNDQLGERCRARQVDVTDPDAVSQWALEVVAWKGAPDLLVNNAAVIARNAPLWEVTPNEAKAIIEVNVLGTISVIRAFAPAMIERGSGVIVNFSSGWGRSTSPDVATYCASKFAIEGLTQALAQELPRGLAAIAMNPGIIDTDMLRSCFGGRAGNYPTPEKWAKRAGPFFLSLGAKHNGASLDVPGGPTD